MPGRIFFQFPATFSPSSRFLRAGRVRLIVFHGPMILVSLWGDSIPANGQFFLVDSTGRSLVSKFGRKIVKTKCVAGIDLRSECFGYVGDPEDTSTWKLPIYFRGNESLTRNHIKNAVERFADCKIPDAQRAEVWRTIVGAARAHGIPAGTQPVSALTGNVHPETVNLLDADELELKEARAVGLLAAEKLLRWMGYAT